MNKKVIPIIISLVLTTFLITSVKATEKFQNPVPTSPIVSTKSESKSGDTSTPESQSNEVEAIELDKLDLPKQIDLVVGDEFKKKDLKDQLGLDESLFLSIISPIKDGVVTKKIMGTHDIFFKIEDRLGNMAMHQAKLVITGKPEITLGRNTINRDDIFTLDLIAPRANDNEDGDISRHVKLLASQVVVDKRVSLREITSFTILLSVTDSDNNETTMHFDVYISEDEVTPKTLNYKQKNVTKTISGSNRYKTAAAMSKEMYSTTSTAIMVYSDDVPSALAAGPLAISLNFPILLTESDKIPSDTKKELTRLGVNKVILIGGEDAISKTVEDELAKMTPAIAVERIHGKDHYETALTVAKKLDKPSKIFLTNGSDFADAMIAGSYASAHGYPIFLTENSKITSETFDYLMKSDAEIFIVGANSAVSSDIEAELKKEGKTVTRIQGENRYATALNMAKKYFPKSPTAVVVSGTKFADTPTAIAYAASMDAPILFIEKDSVDRDITDYLNESTLANFHFIGGDMVITDNAKSYMIYPTLYDVSYQVSDLAGNWSSKSKNGQTAGSTFSKGFSQFYIEPLGNKDISIRYSAYVTGEGWQNISDSTEVGEKGKTIDALIMGLTGSDANKFDIFYRSYSKKEGWSEWTLGGNPVGIPGEGPILAVESRIIKGNANKIDKNIFPKLSKKGTDYYTKSSIKLRVQEDSNSEILLVIPSGSKVEVVSVNSKTNWGKINYTDNGVVHTGYAPMTYIKQDSLASNTILTVNGLNNGDSIPTEDIEITGDAAYRKGINTLTYHINGVEIGSADYGYLSSGGIKYGFVSPVKSGYKFTIPANLWEPSKVNSLKVEILGNDGARESETIYIGGNP